MGTPTPPEKPDWVEGPLHEEWELGRRTVQRYRMWGAPVPPWDTSVTISNKTRAAAIKAWTEYYEEVDRAQDQEG